MKTVRDHRPATSAKDKLVKKIMMCDGRVAITRLIRLSYNICNRPDSSIVDGEMTKLADDGYGKMFSKGLHKGFLKAPKLSDNMLELTGLTAEEYLSQLQKPCDKLSEKANKIFSEAYLAAFPMDAPNASEVHSSCKT